MEHLEGILKLADAEMGSIVKNGKFRSREEIVSVGELVDIVKDIYCIWKYEDGGDERYEDDMSYARDGGSYRYDDASYARGRGRNARRDSMGRYSRNDGYRDGSYRRDGYSRADGKESYIDHLHAVMEDAPDEQTRQEMHRMIQKLEQA